MKIVANLTVISVWILCLFLGFAGMYQLGQLGVLGWQQMLGMLLGAAAFAVPLVRFVKHHEYAPTLYGLLVDLVCMLVSMGIMVWFVEGIRQEVLSARISYGYSLAWLGIWSTVPHCMLTGTYGLIGKFSKISKQF